MEVADGRDAYLEDFSFLIIFKGVILNASDLLVGKSLQERLREKEAFLASSGSGPVLFARFAATTIMRFKACSLYREHSHVFVCDIRR